jgi:hypothetical protein
MKQPLLFVLSTVALAIAGAAAFPLAAAQQSDSRAYQNFKTAIYIPVSVTRQLADPQTLKRHFERISSQLRFDKVYLEMYRNGQFADEAAVPAIQKFLASHHVTVSGGVTLAKGGRGGQFGTFDYEDPLDRAECQRAVELAARHFDEVILDDFFFYTSKSDADIAAKGSRSWTQYRLDKMREVARDLVLKPARASNSRVKLILKYPNWYEHFQGLGYDLDVEAKLFDFIYTGTETRDPIVTDQLLQQYESYLIFRYFDNIQPHGGNRGGWVDTYSTHYVDRYAEQLWDTLFAKAPEITLFNWADMASTDAVTPGDRQAWSGQQTSFNWDEMSRSGPGSRGFEPGLAAARGPAGWARVAGYSLEQVDRVVGQLGKPIGIASYRPYQSSGEDFLQNYLGNIGVPIELAPEFPQSARTVLLTEEAHQDPQIVARIKGQLASGGKVVITSGLLRALQGRGIEDIVELEYTGHKIAVHDFLKGFGAGNGSSLNDASSGRDILFPEIRFYTNDSWALIRGVASAHGVPILLMNRYSRGVLYVLNIPDNIGDLYNLPQPVLGVIRSYLQEDFPVRIDAPAQVSLFAYDNGTFVVQSFRDEPTPVKIFVSGSHASLHVLPSDGSVAAEREPETRRAAGPPVAETHSTFSVQIPPHSYRAFKTE